MQCKNTVITFLGFVHGLKQSKVVSAMSKQNVMKMNKIVWEKKLVWGE